MNQVCCSLYVGVQYAKVSHTMPPPLPSHSGAAYSLPQLVNPPQTTIAETSQLTPLPPSSVRTQTSSPQHNNSIPLPLRSSNPIQLSSSAKSSTLLFFGRKGQAAAALELGFEGTGGLAVGVGDGLGDGLSGAFAG